MESFYYIILYASVLWLPHENIQDVEEEMAEFFNNHKERNGQVKGGTPKEANRIGGKFFSQWRFENDALKDWLETVRLLQWPTRYGEQVEWTPKALNDQWKATDEGDLPIDDRLDNISTNASGRGKKKQRLVTPSHATQVSFHSSQLIASSRTHKSGSSKRPVNKTEFEDSLDESKRQRRASLRLASKNQEREAGSKENLAGSKQQQRSSARLASKK